MEQSQAGRGETALMIATLSVFLARYSNAGDVSNRKYLLGRPVKISNAVDMVNDTATEYGVQFAESTFIHQDILTHALFRLRTHLKPWGIELVVDPSLGGARASRGAENSRSRATQAQSCLRPSSMPQKRRLVSSRARS